DRRLVHVEVALHLDLQGVAVLARTAEGADDLGALYGVVQRDAVAEGGQALGDEGSEGGRAAPPIEVADHHVRTRGAGAVGRDYCADRLHGVDVDVPDRAVARMQGIECLVQRATIRLPATLDARPQ